MASPHFMALSWRDTKIVNYFTNYHSPLDLAIQLKKNKGEINKQAKLIPSKYFKKYQLKYLKWLVEIILNIIME